MFPKWYRHYVLLILTVVYMLNYLDRCLINLLLQPIKEDMHLSDSQLGLLTGIAFGLFYATLGLPIARWADRGDRVTITSVAIGLWGGTVMLCLFVTNFSQLVIARIAAAVGESGCMPPTYSLIGDYFPEPTERTRAMTIYWLAVPLAALLSFLVGGWLNELYGWRVTFFVIGIPAIVVGPLVKLTISEPRTHASAAPDLERPQPPIGKVLRTLWHQRSSRNLSAAIVLAFTMGLGLSPWLAAFMMRSHGMGTAELGFWLGLIFGLGGVVGTLLGGYAAGRWFALDERSQLRLSAVMTASLVPFCVSFLLLQNKHHALIALVPFVALWYFFIGPTFALLQRLVVDEMRATTMAVTMLLANLIGMGIGPQLVGILSDLLVPALGAHSLRYAMLIISTVAFWAAYHFWQAGRTVKCDLAEVARRGEANLRSRTLADGTKSPCLSR